MTTTGSTAEALDLFAHCYQAGIAELPYPPITVSIEATNTCNLRCPMCPVSQDYSGVHRGFMDMSLFRDIADQIAPFTPRICMNIGGESTLHPRLPEMVATLVDRGMAVCLDSNATRLSRTLSRALIDAGLSEIWFCLDGDSPGTYGDIRARARFDETVTNIRDFLTARHSSGREGPHTVIKNIRPWQPDVPLAFPAAYREMFVEHPPDEFRATWMDHWPGTHRERLAEWYDVQPYEDEYYPCLHLWKNLPISWDGAVHLCCLDLNRTSRVGDITRNGVMEVWNSPTLVEARRMHAAGRQSEMSLCRNCNQIRRPPEDPTAGLTSAREYRNTPWVTDRPTIELTVLKSSPGGCAAGSCGE